MLIPFHQLPATSRVWVYQADRKITAAEKGIISEVLTAFTQGWSVHGQPMETSFEIRHDHFIVLAANDQASGCSIDSSVRAVKEAGTAAGVDFFNRTNVAFQTTGGVTLLSMGDLKAQYVEGIWNRTTPVFDNLVDTKGKLDQAWIAPAGDTWLKRYIPAESVLP
ncbi:hypothetical protein KK062_02030 [Fulvivirgaceae bacterium PWU5]|uniref:ABC transporter ATPase n=1 Tax=Dawidia cretensis TaxID=2782350 RepID=A0AAP2GNA9_9BACT|nr:hypothetical protein [Dawidia cretensis]MBT1706979.1 hypothetical protein [Dawidia cretensis]